MSAEDENSRRELAKDPKRKAKSNDPGWKYAYYPHPDTNKDIVKCVLCGNSNHGGINRFKQHLIGGYADIVKCPKTTKEISKEMHDYVQSKKRTKIVQVVEEDGDDERPALVEVGAAMEFAKTQYKKAFVGPKIPLQKKVLKIVGDRWIKQMGKPLYGATLFLNPKKYFDIVEKDPSCASRIREDFNDVLEKMVTDRTTRNLISMHADDYKNSRGSYLREMAIEHRKTKSLFDWWDAYGGRASELQVFAKRIVGLCCSSSGCERNWSTFEFIRTKKRNRLEHEHLNDLVYVQYNQKIESRFKKIRELGKKFNPLIFEDLKWTNEWIDDVEDDFWGAVDRATGASEALEGHTFPRKAKDGSTSDVRMYTRCGSSSTPRDDDDDEWDEDEDITPNDDVDVEDDYGVPPELSKKNSQEGDEDLFDYDMDD